MRLEHWLYIIPLRLRSLFRRGRVEQELDDELRFHLELQAREETVGSSCRELDRSKEECRDMRHVNAIDNLAKDLTYAFRTLRKSPVFAVTAAITIALGIGASTAIFSVTDAVLLRPLPYRDPDRLTMVFRSNPAGSLGSRNFLYSNATSSICVTARSPFSRTSAASPHFARSCRAKTAAWNRSEKRWSLPTSSA